MAVKITQIQQIQCPQIHVFICCGAFKSWKTIEYRKRKFHVFSEDKEAEGSFTAKQLINSNIGKAMRLGWLYAYHSEFAPVPVMV